MISLNRNELTLKDGSVGFLDAEKDPHTFLSFDRSEKIYLKDLKSDIKDFPMYDYRILASSKKTYYDREAYTFLELLGDFGGFNDALFLIIGTISSFYAS